MSDDDAPGSSAAGLRNELEEFGRDALAEPAPGWLLAQIERLRRRLTDLEG